MKRILLLGAFLAPVSLHAQRAEGPSPLKTDSAPRPAPVRREVLPPLVFEAEPRSFQVVRVPIPAVLRAAETVAYEIQPSTNFMVIGTRRGEITKENARADLLVTVRIPADASAGAHMAAHAIFRSGNMEIDVPIETRVRAVYRIRLNVENEIHDVQLGNRVQLHARVANLGNAVDTVRLAFETPSSWNLGIHDTTIVVQAGEVGEKLLRFTVPRKSATGSFFIRTNAASLGASATALTTLSVGNPSADVAPPGPVLRFGLGGVGIPNGSSGGIADLAISGPLTSSIHIDGRIASSPNLSSNSIRGLARVGAYVTEPHFAAWTSEWRLGLGSTVSRTNEIIGVNAGGRGAAFDYQDRVNELHVTAAKEVGSIDARGSSFGAEFDRRVRFGTVGVSLARLRGSGFGDQKVNSFGIHGSGIARKDVNVEGALAYRDFARGTGLGLIAGVSGKLPRTAGTFRFIHAPGGTSAFARAENELVATTTTQVDDRLQISASLFSTSDKDVSANNVGSRVFSITPSYQLGEALFLRAEMRTSSFEVRANPFAFTNGELHLGAGVTTGHKGTTYSGDASIDRLTRGVRTDNVNARDAGARIGMRLNASRPLSFGALQVEASYDHNDRSTGFVPHQVILTARADHAQIPRISRNLFLDGEIGVSYWSGVRTYTTFRMGASYSLADQTEVTMSIERNPMMYASGTSAPVVFALRVERSFGLPRLITGRAAGVIYQDYNGDGRRDPDEPGMPNIRVRRGDSHATTDANGRYRFWEESRGNTVVDVTTLPTGWIVSGRPQDGNIAVTPTTRVEVNLMPGLAERVRKVDLSQLVVTARDDAGRIFVARRTASDIAVFEALPVGSYEIGIDASGMAEPLRIDGTPPRINVTRESVKTITLPLAGRPLRFKGKSS